MKIGDWIDAQDPPVPASFRACLMADGPASTDGVVAAALEALETVLPAARATGDDDREAAYSLLALDAYVTYACLLALRADDAAAEIDGVAAALAGQWPPRGVPERSS